MSHDLKIGEIRELYVTEDVIWQHLNNFYYRSAVSTSYKYVFFKSLLENLYNVGDDLSLSYDQIFYSFTTIYWNLVIHHDLEQSPNKNKRLAHKRFCRNTQTNKAFHQIGNLTN